MSQLIEVYTLPEWVEDTKMLLNKWEIGATVTSCEKMNRKEKNKILLLFGGADVGPEYYHEPYNYRTYSNKTQDKREFTAISKAKDLQIPIFGICKGFQWTCVLAGLVLNQHIEGHAGTRHEAIVQRTQQRLQVNSTHHQCGVLEKHQENLAKDIVRAHDGVLESAIYEEVLAGGVQWHPEYPNCPESGVLYAKQVFLKLLEYNK